MAIQNKYASDNFQVLAFPCNDFGQQEPNVKDGGFMVVFGGVLGGFWGLLEVLRGF